MRLLATLSHLIGEELTQICSSRANTHDLLTIVLDIEI